MGTLSLAGCINPNAPIKTRVGKLTQAQVDAIVGKCGGPSGMAIIDEGELVIYRAQDIAITGCVLKGLEETGETSLSSVGNTRYRVTGKQ